MKFGQYHQIGSWSERAAYAQYIAEQKMRKTEPELLQGVIITMTVSAETVDDLLMALAWVSHPRYIESARYWDKHLSPLRGGNHQMAIPFASFMSLAAAVLACDFDEHLPRDWLRAQLAGVALAIEQLAPAAAADVRSVIDTLG